MPTDNGFLGLDPYLSAGDLPGGGLDFYTGISGQPPYQNLGTRSVHTPLGKAQKFLDPIGGALLGGLFDKEKNRTPAWQRLANREWAQGNAVLSAYNSLYEPTLALARRSAADYGDLYRRAANETLSHQLLTQSTMREGDLRDFAKLGPEYIANLRATNPALAALYDQSLEDFQLGDQLSGSQSRNIQQSVRAGQAARGMGLGPADVYQEAIQTSGYGDALKQQRWQNLLQSLGLYGDVFQATTGRPALAPAPQGASIQAPDYGGFNNDLFSYGVSREIQGRNLEAAQGARRDALIGGIIQGVLGAAGGAAGGLCWVAREVYGARSPKWRLFRHWLLTLAPHALQREYIKHGQALAALLKRSPRRKRQLRTVFDTILASPLTI